MEPSTNKYTIKEFPENLRPRERLLRHSAAALSDYELLAILLQSGSTKTNVLELAQELLTKTGGLQGLKEASIEELCAIHGIGESKACMVLAAIELARRLHWLSDDLRQPAITDTVTAAAVLQQSIQRTKQEVFAVLYLNTKHHLIRCDEVFVGTLDAAMVHMRDIFRNAVKYSARAMIVGHNHPSGVTEPSQNDLLLTKRLVEAGQLMEIPVLDHIIIGADVSHGFYSFKEHQLM